MRDVELPYGAGTMVLVTLDNGRDHTRPNTFGPAGLLALRDALDAGWPFHLGGITPYLDRAGIAEKVTSTRFHL